MFTIQKERENKLVVNRSKFLGYVFYCNGEEKREKIIKDIKREHPSATHVCYAHIFYDNNEIKTFYTDDREPSGTAGVPIFNVLRENQMIDTLCVIVRYFGGVKLGSQNLTKAYKDCASGVVLIGENKQVELKTRCNFECSYDAFNILNKKLNGLKSAKVDFVNNVKLDIMLTDDEIKVVQTLVGDIETKEKFFC